MKLIFFEQLFDQCPSDCAYIFEVPDFDCLIESLRFDAIFHQHLHYFSLSTLTNLIIECGGEVTDHLYNYQGPCGGSLLVSFKKSNKKNLGLVNINIEDKKQKFDSELEKELAEVEKEIKDLKKSSLSNISKIAVETSADIITQIIDINVNKSNVSAIVNDIAKRKMEKHT